jgi:hypothetical protein
MITSSINKNICGRAGAHDAPDDQLPAIIETPVTPPTIVTPVGAYIVPALITDAGGDQAGWRYVEFFTANINNDHTRRAYTRACSGFFAWCEIAARAVAQNHSISIWQSPSRTAGVQGGKLIPKEPKRILI